MKGRPGLAAGAQRLRVRLTAAVQACTAGGSSAQLVRAGENRARMFLVAMLNMRGGAGVCIPPHLQGQSRIRGAPASACGVPLSGPGLLFPGHPWPVVHKKKHTRNVHVYMRCVLCASTGYTTNLLVIVYIYIYIVGSASRFEKGARAWLPVRRDFNTA